MISNYACGDISGFTATVTEEVKEDIICVLRLENPTVVVTGFDRKNLYRVREPLQIFRYVKALFGIFKATNRAILINNR